jgi:hypothetical protein
MALPPTRKEAAAPFGGPRARDPAAEYIRIGLGVAILLILVLSGLAFINSFFLEPPAPQGPGGEPSDDGQQEAGDQGGGAERACTRIVATLQVMFWLVAVATVLSLGLAVVRRAKHQNRIATNPWGILATVLFFASLLFLGLWRISNFVCNKSPNCLNTTNGSYTTYLFLISLTLAGVGGGMLIAHFRRIRFFSTGFGLIGVVLYIPAILSGFAWYIIRLVCSPRLSCATRDQFLDTLLLTFWLALAGGVVAVFCGILVMRAMKIDLFRSGWGVLAILLIALSMFAGGGWKLASGIAVPGCDAFTGEEPTCEGIKSDLQDTLRETIWTLVIVALLMGGGFYFYRSVPGKFFTSPFAIFAYVLLMLAGLVGLLLIFSGTLCGEDEPSDEPPESTPTGSPTPGPTASGTNRPGPTGTSSGPSGTGGTSAGGTSGPPGSTGAGGPPGGSGGGGAGGGSAGGGGSGGSGVGPPQVPLELGTIPLVWVLVIVGALVVGALLILLLRHRKVVLARPPKVPPVAQVQAAERASLLKMLDNANLRSAEAVIAAYRGFLAWCVQRGFAKMDEETPREHAERVRQAYPVPPASMRAFIDAYEVARLSTREPTPAERQNAVRFARDIDNLAWKDPEAPQ